MCVWAFVTWARAVHTRLGFFVVAQAQQLNRNSVFSAIIGDTLHGADTISTSKSLLCIKNSSLVSLRGIGKVLTASLFITNMKTDTCIFYIQLNTILKYNSMLFMQHQNHNTWVKMVSETICFIIKECFKSKRGSCLPLIDTSCTQVLSFHDPSSRFCCLTCSLSTVVVLFLMNSWMFVVSSWTVVLTLTSPPPHPLCRWARNGWGVCILHYISCRIRHEEKENIFYSLCFFILLFFPRKKNPCQIICIVKCGFIH